VVLEGDSVAEALARYAAESGVRNLVLGSASLPWFRRYIFQFLVHFSSSEKANCAIENPPNDCCHCIAFAPKEETEM
jgi:K+-sensing histidine kinase KdpD